MPNSYHQIYIQAVFAVKYRKAQIKKNWKSEMLGVIGNLINESRSKVILVNGTSDHVHCFFGLHPADSVSKLMQTVKAKSSKWLNETGHLNHRFEWQEGYGAFSYNRSHVDAVYKYIQNQENHHKKVTFLNEYINMLEKFGIEYDEKYIFHELI